MTENEEFIFESIRNDVRMGFLSPEEIKESIVEEIEDNGFEDEISIEWAFKAIHSEYNKLVVESENWIKPNDTEKLINSFDELCKNNIIALHNAGYTNSDGEYEVVEVERHLRENNIVSDGYCFYHEQDLSRAISAENPSLLIAFQKINNSNDQVTIEVGKKIVKILTKNGLKVEWNEKPTNKILLPGFKWQMIYNENNRNLQDYSDTLKLMTGKKQNKTLDTSIESEISKKEGNLNKKHSWWKKFQS